MGEERATHCTCPSSGEPNVEIVNGACVVHGINAQRLDQIEAVLGLGNVPVYGAGNRIVAHTTARMSSVLDRHASQIASLQRSLASIEREVFPVHGFTITDGKAGAVSVDDTKYTAQINAQRARAANALTQAAEDFDTIQRSVLQMVTALGSEAKTASPEFPTEIIIALADMATSLGDMSSACTLAAREARR